MPCRQPPNLSPSNWWATRPDASCVATGARCGRPSSRHPCFRSSSAAAWGHAVSGTFDLGVAALALLATMLVHAGANVINDVADDESGTDRANTERIFPYTGGSRFIQNKILSARRHATFWHRAARRRLSVRRAARVAQGSAGAQRSAWRASRSATLYSLRPVQLAGRGVGELAIGVAFGILPVTGAAWLQSGRRGFCGSAHFGSGRPVGDGHPAHQRSARRHG